jgi:hypothetical protein
MPSAVLRRALLAAATAATVVGIGVGGAASASAACVDVSATYPGDGAADVQIAAWMAGGAARAGLPGELPVMAALVESGLKNLPGGDADSVGYFQMRAQYWNTGPYAGYATNPALQLQWFTDQAPAVENGRAADSSQWGEWIADIERPAAQYRGRYQLQLAAAQQLISPGCSSAVTAPGTQPGTGAPIVIDTTPPKATVSLALRQRVAKTHALAASVVCRDEACTATADGRVAGHGLSQALKVSSRPTPAAMGQTVKLKLIAGPTLRRAVRAAVHHGVPLRAAITVTVTDAAGNAAAKTLRATLVG